MDSRRSPSFPCRCTAGAGRSVDSCLYEALFQLWPEGGRVRYWWMTLSMGWLQNACLRTLVCLYWILDSNYHHVAFWAIHLGILDGEDLPSLINGLRWRHFAYCHSVLSAPGGRVSSLKQRSQPCDPNRQCCDSLWGVQYSRAIYASQDNAKKRRTKLVSSRE